MTKERISDHFPLQMFPPGARRKQPSKEYKLHVQDFTDEQWFEFNEQLEKALEQEGQSLQRHFEHRNVAHFYVKFDEIHW